jgi:TonB family protein
MSKKLFLIVFVVLNISLSMMVFSQIRNRVALHPGNNASRNSEKSCQVFINGKILSNPKPVYPAEAKASNISGKVEVVVDVDENGNVTAIENVVGPELLKAAATATAMKAKFSPPTCDGVPSKTVGVVTFNFAPLALIRNYPAPANIEGFPDISTTDEFYEAAVFLTENYKIAFGYADGKFHAEMPLTKGDFAHFLRQTLDLLDSRARFAKKDINEIPLYHHYNPYNLKEIEFNSALPSAISIKTLADKYGIVLADKNNSFDESDSLTQNEVIEIWRGIFGDEVIPVNFVSGKAKTEAMSRGDFAIFLNESLGVLTYKILP